MTDWIPHLCWLVCIVIACFARWRIQKNQAAMTAWCVAWRDQHNERMQKIERHLWTSEKGAAMTSFEQDNWTLVLDAYTSTPDPDDRLPALPSDAWDVIQDPALLLPAICAMSDLGLTVLTDMLRSWHRHAVRAAAILGRYER